MAQGALWSAAIRSGRRQVTDFSAPTPGSPFIRLKFVAGRRNSDQLFIDFKRSDEINPVKPECLFLSSFCVSRRLPHCVFVLFLDVFFRFLGVVFSFPWRGKLGNPGQGFGHRQCYS